MPGHFSNIVNHKIINVHGVNIQQVDSTGSFVLSYDDNKKKTSSRQKRTYASTHRPIKVHRNRPSILRGD